MKLERVKIENFMGVESDEFEVGEGGNLFTGPSRSGKTSRANAPFAALKGRGWGPECIRTGADKYRIMLKFDKATLSKVVRRSGSTELKVDGLGLGTPQAKLDALFPDMIDPLLLANEKPAERKKRVLSVMPVTVTAEDLKRWTGADWTVDPNKHGLEVVEGVRDVYYKERTAANATAKLAKQKADEAMAKARAMAAADSLEPGIVVPVTVGDEDAPVRAAERALDSLTQRQAQAAEQERRAAGTRDRIAKLKAEADKWEDLSQSGPTPDDLKAASDAHSKAHGLVARLKAQLVEAEKVELSTRLEMDKISTHIDSQRASERKANDLREQAAGLESSLSAVAIAPVSSDELEAARVAVEQAKDCAAKIRAARAAHDAAVDAAHLGDVAKEAQADASRLDDLVKKLSDEVPAELAKRSQMIPGLTFTEDDIALDGKVFKVLSESERIELCVEVAKRLAPEGKLLRIDRLESMDPDLREEFIRKAKSGGWQILGTVVERGEMRIVTIDADDAVADGEVAQPAQAE